MSKTEFEISLEAVRGGGNANQEADRLVALMTRAEKLGCLDGDVPVWPGLNDLLQGGYHRRTWPAARVDRLGIPGIHFSDGPRGAVVGANTVFPVSMARGATFNPALEKQIGQAIGAELRAQGATYTGAVCMNLLRHPAWGRAQETYGEDPHHVGEMARAFTLGLQQHVMACMKHFALNSKENKRFVVDVKVEERALHEVYLPHFRKVADAGVASVMSAYNQVNGEYCGENKTLLIDILRTEWGWDGFVTSDFILGLRDPVKSIKAGLNIEMPFRQQREMVLTEALEGGELEETQVDARVSETLATLLRFGHVFETQPDASVRVSPEHRQLARASAAASMVLLRNENDLLPLNAESLNRVAVLGRLAGIPNLGDAGSSHVALQTDVVTPMDGLRIALPGVELVHSDDDPSVASNCDVVLVVVGYTRFDEGEYIGEGMGDALQHLLPPMDHPTLGMQADYIPSQSNASNTQTPQSSSPEIAVAPLGDAAGGDRQSIRLSEADETLIRGACATSAAVIVVVMGGSAVVMPWLDETSATLMIWYPGMEGGNALADVLLGKTEPGGRLPFVIPRTADELPHFDRDEEIDHYDLLHGQWYLDSKRTPPHKAFGFGMGYTSWRIVEAARAEDHVAVTLVNTGPREGSTVLMIFGSVPSSEYERAPRKLMGFERISLKSEESREIKVAFDIRVLDLRVEGKWVREQKPVELSLGFSATEADLIYLQ